MFDWLALQHAIDLFNELVLYGHVLSQVVEQPSESGGRGLVPSAEHDQCVAKQLLNVSTNVTGVTFLVPRSRSISGHELEPSRRPNRIFLLLTFECVWTVVKVLAPAEA